METHWWVPSCVHHFLLLLPLTQLIKAFVTPQMVVMVTVVVTVGPRPPGPAQG